MELLERLVTVELERLTEPTGQEAASAPVCVPVDGDLHLHPRQALRFRLSVRFDADSETKTNNAVTFLSQIGEARLEEAWSLLFDRVVLSPFLLSGRAAAVVGGRDEDEDDEEKAESDEDGSSHSDGDDERVSASSASSAPTGEWRDAAVVLDAGAAHRPTLPSLALDGISSPLMPPPAGPATAVLRSPSASSSCPLPRRERGAVFAFGAQGFWLDRAYQGATSGSELSPSASTAGADDECFFGGPAITAACAEVVVTSAETKEAAVLAHRLSIPSAMVIPRSICSHYVFDYMVPDENLWASSPLDSPRALAFVLLLPLHHSGSSAREDDYFVIRRVLSRGFVDSFSANYLFASAPLGCCFVPVHVRPALACESVAYPLSNDQLLLSLSITNPTALPVRLQSVSLDLYSTHESHALPSALSWGATRPAAQGHDRRLIELLTKLVTVTPMIVSDDRPPFTLQPEETYSFQCILQVVPEFNHVLNPSSLEHVYERLSRDVAAAAAATAATTASGSTEGVFARVVVPPRQTGSSTSTVLRDDDGNVVTTEDVVKVMTGVYQSYMFVYYQVGEAAASVDGAPSSMVSGLHLRHPVQWSFGI